MSLTPESRYVHLQDLRLHLSCWNGEPSAGQLPILMLHGFLDTGASFAELATALGRPALAWDARGFGRSDWVAPHAYYHFFDYLWDLHQLLQALELEQVILLGHSMGGMAASLYAGTFPERVKALINLEGWLLPDSDPQQTPERVRGWLTQREQLAPFHSWPRFEEAAARLQRQDPRLTPEQTERLASHSLTQTPEGFQWRHDPLHRTRSPQPFRLDQALAFWRQITAPTLLLYGAASPIRQLPDWDQRMLAFEYQSACLVREVPEAGHNLHLHQPQQLAEWINNWLQSYDLA